VALIVDHLTVALGGDHVLHDVSATFAAGQITAILGPNGAGKSTLLKAMAGLLPVMGKVAIDGQSVATMPAQNRGRRIGYLAQAGIVHWNLSVGDTVALGRMPYRRPFVAASESDRVAIAAALAATDMTDFAKRGIATLSGGERARALLARVLAGTPDWIFADEPLASLDPAHQMDLLDRFRTLAQQGVGIVLVLHDLAHAARIADSVLILKAGRILGHGPTAEVIQPALLAEAYGIDFETIGGLPFPVVRMPG
jgi:iron complex transport system ATP-binding protein